MIENDNVQCKVPKDKCTGCMVCKDICHVGAISFQIKQGFRYPSIDSNKCVNCGMCTKKCPSINKIPNKNKIEDMNAYAAWTKNIKQRELSTSGGVCFELSKYVLENNGFVAGVAWTDNCKDAEYVLISKIDDLQLISQSKYFQPRMNNIYIKVYEKLKEGRTVLFIGTACSCAALKVFLPEEYDNLICCDFICRGYTSQIFHKKRIEYLELIKGKSISNVQYKNKDIGWTKFGTKFFFDDGSDLYVNRVEDSYEVMFKLNDFNTRPSCFECKYRCLPRATDITVGDFWHIEKTEPENLKYGISAVLVFSNKGANLFKKISDQIEYENRNMSEISKGNPALLHKVERPKQDPEKFFDDLENKSFNIVKRKYSSRGKIKMKNAKIILSKILHCNIFQFLKINFFTYELERKKHKYIFPYWGSKIEIQKGSKVIVNENLVVNKPKHKHSNEQAYIRVMRGGSFEINGASNLAANACIEVLPNAKFAMGKVETNYGTTIVCSNEILIGDEVDIGRNTMIYDSNFHPTSFNSNKKMKPLIIKDHVWICSGVTITKGITINEGAICGINSTVTRNVKSKDLVMGNPAKAVMSNMEW